MQPKDQALRVWGDLACFSRPEMKVERFSYPVITPSAARGVFDAVYCKPKEFHWQVTRIEVLKPPNFIGLRRNEVKDKVNLAAVHKWMNGKAEPEPLWADGDKNLLGTDMKGRTQRQTMALKDVAYVIHAEIRPWPRFAERQQALEAQFRRRAAVGKCVWQPYLGCREFPAFFELLEVGETAAPTALDQDLGYMLYDVFDLSRPGNEYSSPVVSLFKARISGGVLEVPPYESPLVFKAAGGAAHA